MYIHSEQNTFHCILHHTLYTALITLSMSEPEEEIGRAKALVPALVKRSWIAWGGGWTMNKRVLSCATLDISGPVLPEL